MLSPLHVRMHPGLALLSLLFTTTAIAQTPAGPSQLVGHAGAINSAIYSPDGAIIATCAADQLVKLWDAKSGEELRALTGHQGQVLSLAISSDGRTLYSGGADNVIRQWDVPRAGPLHRFQGHASLVSDVVIGPNNRIAITGGIDSSLRLWDLETNTIAAIWEGHESEVRKVAYRADGNEVASGDADGSILLWNILTGKPLAKVGAHDGAVVGLAYHPNNQQLFSLGRDRLLTTWQLPVREPRPIGELAVGVQAADITSDSQTAVIATGQEIQVVSIANGAVLRSLEAMSAGDSAIDISPNNALVATADANGTILLHNIADGALRGRLVADDVALTDVKFHSASDRLATASADGTIRTWRLPGESTPLAGHAVDVLRVAVAPNQSYLVTTSSDGSVRMFDPINGQAIRQFNGHESSVDAASIVADGSQLITADAGGNLRVWSTADAKALAVRGIHGKSVTAMAAHPNGKLLVTAGEDGTLKRWPLPLPNPTPLPGNTAAVTAAAISDDASLIALGGADKSIRLYNGATGEQVQALTDQTDAITSVAIADSNETIVSATADGILRFYKQDGTLIGELHGHTGAVNQLDLDSTTGQVATAGADGTIRIWRVPSAPEELAKVDSAASRFVVSPDGRFSATVGTLQERPAVFVHELADGDLIHTLLGHVEPITAIAFNHDATLLATGSADKTARVWSLAEAKFAQLHSIEQPAAVTSVAFSADATDLLVASADNAIRQWTLADETEVRALTGHGGAIAAMQVQGNTLYSAGADSTVRSWNLTTGAPIRSINHGSAVQAIAVSADGTTLASGGENHLVKLWNSANGAAVATLERNGSPIKSLTFADDSSVLLSTSNEQSCLWDVTSASLLQAFPLGEWPAAGADFTAAGDETAAASDLSRHRVVIAGTDGSLRSLRPDLLRRLTGHDGEVAGVGFLPGGTEVVSCGIDKTVRRWDLTGESVVQQFAGLSDAATSLDVAGDGQLLACGSVDQHVYLWSLAAEPTASNEAVEAVQIIELDSPATSVAFGGESGHLAIASADGTARVWDTASGYELERFMAHAEAVNCVALSADGRTLVSGGADMAGNISRVSGEIIGFDAETVIRDIAFTPDGNQLIAAGGTANLTIWPVNAELEMGDPSTVPPQDADSQWSAEPKQRVAIHPMGHEVVAVDSLGQANRWSLEAMAVLSPIKPISPVDDGDNDDTPTGAVAFDASGTHLVIGLGDRLQIFDATTSKLLESLASPAPIRDVAFTNSDRLAVVGGGAQNQANLIDRSLLRWWVAHEGSATSLAYSTDSTKIVTGGVDGQTKIWNVEEKGLVETLASATDAVTEVAITPDGSRIIASSADGLVRVWPTTRPADQEKGESRLPVAQWEHLAAISHLSVSADSSKVITTAGDGIARLWDLTLARPIQRWKLSGEEPFAIIASDNKTVLAGGEGGAMLLETNVSRSQFIGENAPADLAIYNSGTLAAVATGSEVSIVNLASGESARQIECEDTVFKIAVRGDNAQLAAVTADNKLRLFNLSDGSATVTLDLPAETRGLAYSPDNQKLVVALSDGSLRFIATTDAKLLYEVKSSQPLTTAAVTSDSRRVLTGAAEGAVELWSYASPDSIRTLTGHGGNIYGVALSPDDLVLASASADQSIRLWNTETGAQIRQLSGHVGPVYGLAFSPDGSLLASCGDDKSIRIWDVLGGRQLKQIPVSEKSLYSVAFHPGGQLVSAAGLEKKIYVYNALAGTLQSTLEGHDDYIYRVAYNQSGTRLLSCGYSGEVKVWNTANGQQLFEKATGQIANLAGFSPDDARILVASGDGRARILDLPATAK